MYFLFYRKKFNALHFFNSVFINCIFIYLKIEPDKQQLTNYCDTHKKLYELILVLRKKYSNGMMFFGIFMKCRKIRFTLFNEKKNMLQALFFVSNSTPLGRNSSLRSTGILFERNDF